MKAMVKNIKEAMATTSGSSENAREMSVRKSSMSTVIAVIQAITVPRAPRPMARTRVVSPAPTAWPMRIPTAAAMPRGSM